MIDYRNHRTERLLLTALEESDLGDWFALHADPRVWSHRPQGRHTSREQSAAKLAANASGWTRGRLGYWAAREPGGGFVGVGGCEVVGGTRWNLYYRLVPEFQGRGYAGEIARAGLDAAYEIDPDLPRTAFLVEHNHASRVLAERSGLTLQWRGLDAANPDQSAIRLVYADRHLTDTQLAALRG